MMALFHHLIGAGEDRLWDRQAEQPGGFGLAPSRHDDRAQHIFVVPELDFVVVLTSGLNDNVALAWVAHSPSLCARGSHGVT